MITFKNWNEFINFKGNHTEKISMIQNSSLGAINPGNQRAM